MALMASPPLSYWNEPHSKMLNVEFFDLKRVVHFIKSARVTNWLDDMIVPGSRLLTLSPHPLASGTMHVWGTRSMPTLPWALLNKKYSPHISVYYRTKRTIIGSRVDMEFMYLFKIFTLTTNGHVTLYKKEDILWALAS